MLKEKNTTFAAVSIYYSTFKNMEIREYRQLILDELLARKNAKGEPVIDEKTAKDLLNELTDEESEEGMLFNEPADVADIIIQSKKLCKQEKDTTQRRIGETYSQEVYLRQ